MAAVEVLNIDVAITSTRMPEDEFTIQVALNDKYFDSNDFAGSLRLPDFIEHVVGKSVARLTKRYLENGVISKK